MKKLVVFFFLALQSWGYGQQKMEIYFDFDRFDLNPQAIQTLNTWISQGKNYKVTKLFGFCDWKGTNRYNDTLAMRRVNTVYAFLLNQKIQVEKNIEIRGFGEDFKQSPKQEENRRVTLIYEEVVPVVVETPLPKPMGATLKQQIAVAKKGDVIKLEHINFLNHSAKFVPNTEPILLDLLCVLEENPTLKIEIQGHICCDTENKYVYISEARAKAVYNYLIGHKIDRKRLSFKGYGATQPIFKIPERNVQEEDANRRVEVKIIER
jgi:outer membrane protein OmpA-like peptidoglycan-associated protein